MDIDKLDLRKNGFSFEKKVELPTTKAKRDRQFIPHLPAPIFRRLVKTRGKTWAVYLVLWRRSRLESNRTVLLTSCSLREFGLTRNDKYLALARLETAGLIRVQRRKNRNPVVELVDDGTFEAS
jgi:hypothetical protein